MIDWNEDSWFSKHHAKKVTPEFSKWWQEFYGPPEKYDPSEDEQREYWVRCAYALIGWIARGQA